MKNEAVIAEVPTQDRQSWVSVMFIWVGSMICLPSILIGSTIISGLTFWKAIIAGIIGYIFILIITILQGMQSTDLGKPTIVVSEQTYGKTGSRYIFSSIITVSLIGWFGIQAELAGDTVTLLLKNIFNITIPTQISSLIIGILMLITAVYGFKLMKYMNFIAVPLMIIVLTGAFINALGDITFSTLSAYTPTDSISFLQAIGITVGGFIIGAVIAGDFTRFNKNRNECFKSALFGIVPAGILLIIVGAVLFVLAGSDDLVTILLAYFPSAIMVYVMLLLATWTTNVTNAYSAGLAITTGFDLDDDQRPKMTIISGLIGTVLAVLGILDHFENFLIILTTLVTPIGGVMIADYWIIARGDKEKFLNKEPHYTLAIYSWIIGCVPALIVTPPFNYLFPKFITENSLIVGVSSFIGIIISMLIYLIGVKCYKGKLS